MADDPGIAPRLRFWHRLDVAARYSVPAALTVLVLLLLGLPFGLPGQAPMQPAWAVACVYFWSLYRPASLPAAVVFGIGILLDLLAEGPIGVHPLILLAVHGTVLRLRRFLTRQGFGAVWLVFVGVAAAACITEFAATVVVGWQIMAPWPAMFEWMLAVGAYPVLSVGLTRLHRGIAAPEQA